MYRGDIWWGGGGAGEVELTRSGVGDYGETSWLHVVWCLER